METGTKVALVLSLLALVVSGISLAVPHEDSDRVAQLQARVEQLESSRDQRPPLDDFPQPEANDYEADIQGTSGSSGVKRRPGFLGGAPTGELERLEGVLEADPENPQIRSKLRGVIAEEQERLRDERWEQRLDRRRERTVERVREFAEKHDLDAMETEQLEDLMVKEQNEIGEIFRDARRDMNFEDAREMATILRTETDKQVQALLTPEAFEHFREQRAEETQRWGGRPGGRRDNTNATDSRSSE